MRSEGPFVRIDASCGAVPRGVITAATVAEELDLDVDVLVLRRLPAPGNEELALGAIGPGGVRVLNEDVIAMCGIDPLEIDLIEAASRRWMTSRSSRHWPARMDASAPRPEFLHAAPIHLGRIRAVTMRWLLNSDASTPNGISSRMAIFHKEICA